MSRDFCVAIAHLADESHELCKNIEGDVGEGET